MLPSSTVAELKRLLARADLSQRKIARRTGVSRSTVGRIAGGKRKERVPKTKEPWEIAATGKIGRCPVCGAKVKLPCLYCIIRNLGKSGTETGVPLKIALELKDVHQKRYEQVKAWREQLERFDGNDCELPEDWPFRKRGKRKTQNRFCVVCAEDDTRKRVAIARNGRTRKTRFVI